jgi:tape measure domain-containing protein
VATDTEIIDVLVRLRGGRAAAAEADSFAGSVAGIGKAAGGVAIALGALSAVGAGLRFDSTMEQNTIAFTHFLGSTQAATAELQTLYQIAATTPFQFSDVTTATRRFLAFGFSLQETNAELKLIGDAVAGVGGTADEINRMVLVLGQIHAAGKLQGQDLLQLEQFGIVSRVQIAQQLGLSVEKFNSEMRKSKITSEEAIAAINATISTQFAGSAAEQAKSVQGQLSTIKDYGAQAAGALVQPIFDLAQSSILPSISNQLQTASKYLTAGGAQDFYNTLGQILKILSPLIVAFVAYRAALIGVAIAEGLVAAGAAAMAFVGTLAAVIALIPAVTSLADVVFLLDAAFAANPIGIIVVAIAALIAGLVYAYEKVGWFHDAVDAVFSFIADHWRLLTIILAGPIGAAVVLIIDHFDSIKEAARGAINWIIRAWNSLQFTLPHLHVFGHDLGGQSIGVPRIPLLANGGQVPVGGAAIVGEAGPELLTNSGGTANVTPLGGGGRGGLAHFVLMLPDLRVLAEGVAEEGHTAVARGG